MKKIKLNAVERQSGLDRVRHAELLIVQLSPIHDGRNTWLLNYGTSDEAKEIRMRNGIDWDPETRSAVLR